MANTMTGPTGATGTTKGARAGAFVFDQYYPGGVWKQLLDFLGVTTPGQPTGTTGSTGTTGPTGATGSTEAGSPNHRR